MHSPRVTLRDIARRVGVHPSTVSRVLNPSTRHKVSQAVIERVLGSAEELGYRPNPLAYGLRTNRSMTVGVVVPDITNPIFPPIIRGVESTLEDAGYTAILANSDNNVEREKRIVEFMRARHIDGLILATAYRHDPLVEACMEDGVPFVLVHRETVRDDVSTVTADNALGMAMLVEHLIGLGHRHIAHVAGPQIFSTGTQRYQGYLAALRENGITPDPDLVAFCETFTDVEAALATKTLLGRGKPISAITAANDILALGCLDALREKGLRCPVRISVTGYNDIRFAGKVRPPLTTIRIPQYDAGVAAAQLLLERLADPGATARSLCMEPTLVVRDSTGPAPP